MTGMSNEHEPPQTTTPVDSGSQALAEALRSSFAIVKVVMLVLLAVFIFSGCHHLAFRQAGGRR
jgi:hypothetical protein